LLLYLPVIHAGYEALFDRHRDAEEVLLLGASFAEDFPALRKEIRALSPQTAVRYVTAVREFPTVRVIERDELPGAIHGEVLVLPDEEVTRSLVATYDLDLGRTVVFERTFLRWDREWSLAQRPADYDGVIAADTLARSLTLRAGDEAKLSSDWWRQVGALAVRDGDVLAVAHNEHLPTEYSPYINGDPRNEFRRGVHIELSTAIHAEAAIVARASRTGTVLAGADLYVSTFPCPTCARLIAEAGFRRCFFAGPYAMLDGDEVLRAAGVEMIWVDLAGA
jgi:dCMP deaminase